MSDKIHTVHVGFGANLGDPLDTYAKAKVLLQDTLGPLLSESAMYESAALTVDGTESQTNYFNAVLVFRTTLTPAEVLRVLLQTEVVFKRNRIESVRWAPRMIDLDILFMEDLVVNEPGLTIPHPELHNRDFVLCPMYDVAPDLNHPVLGQTVRELESSLTARGCKRLIIRRCGLAKPLVAVTHCVP